MASTSFVYGLPSEVVTPTWSLTDPDPEYPAINAGDFSDRGIPKPALSTMTDDTLAGTLSDRVDWLVVWHDFDEDLPVIITTSTSTVTIMAPRKRKNGYTAKLDVDLTVLSGYTTAPITSISIGIGGSPNNNSVPVGFKVLCFSRRRQFDRDLKMGYRFQRPNRGLEHTTDGGAIWHYSLPSGARVLSGLIEPTDASLVDLIDWYEDSDGRVTAIADLAGHPGEAYLVRLRSSGATGLLNASGAVVTTLDTVTDPYGIAVDFHSTPIAVEEVSAGLPEWT